MGKFLFFLFFIFVGSETKTLIMGDSISVYANGWQDVLCKQKNLNCTNIAKGGMKTNWMVKTLREHLKSDHSYSQVIIYGGINDIFSYVPIDSAVKNVERMVAICKSHKIKPIVIIGYDPNTIIHNSWVTDRKLETKLRNEYIEYQKRLMHIQGAEIIPMVPTTSQDSGDGIHLSRQGHKTFAEYFSKYF